MLRNSNTFHKRNRFIRNSIQDPNVIVTSLYNSSSSKEIGHFRKSIDSVLKCYIMNVSNWTLLSTFVNQMDDPSLSFSLTFRRPTLFVQNLRITT